MSTVVQRVKPTSPGRRGLVVVKHSHLEQRKGHRKLLAPLKKSGGRNHNGRITVRRRGGGHKRLYRIIDFKRNKHNIPGIVERIEYDPNRTAHIALIKYKDGEWRYIIAPKGLQKGAEIVSGIEAPIQVGNALPLSRIPDGTTIHCIELKPEKGAQICRSDGAYAQLLGHSGDYVTVRLRSGEIRKIHSRCMAVIGEVGHAEHNLGTLGKAGASRWRGRRPTVRGVAMNPVDHPHGGGEGRSSGGRHPVTPWGVPTKGYKTRRNKRTDKYIVRRRKRKR